jgi:hypothetical protein
LFGTVPVNLIHGHYDLVQSCGVSYCKKNKGTKKLFAPSLCPT